MANITMDMIKELRAKTGSGMMDCKKALAESNGDVEAAVAWLREKGIATAAKKSSRIAAEGMVASAISADAKVGALIEVNIETDFAAKNEEFGAFVKDCAEQVVANSPADVAAFLEQSFAQETDKTVAQVVQEKIVKIGENISIRRFERFAVSDNGCIVSYIHGAGRVGVMMEATAETAAGAANADFVTFVKDCAMQVAAMNPSWVSKDEVDEASLEKERSIVRNQALNEGKPEAIVDKIVIGRLNKFYTENCLLEQVFVKDDSKTIAALVKEISAKVGEKLAIKRFVRYELGEGIEKKEENFADEVAAQLK